MYGKPTIMHVRIVDAFESVFESFSIYYVIVFISTYLYLSSLILLDIFIGNINCV